MRCIVCNVLDAVNDHGLRLDDMFRLNLVGSRMLELFKQGHTEREIAEQVSKEFRVGREVVASDLHEFLAHLEKHHLLELHPSPTRSVL